MPLWSSERNGSPNLSEELSHKSGKIIYAQFILV